jgi:hypothetical protein
MSPESCCKEVVVCQCLLRQRRCLLKGCEQIFHPTNVFSRYCSERCVRAARCWTLVRARKKYRLSRKARAKRAEQSCKHRQRCRELKANQAVSSLDVPQVNCEGHHPGQKFEGALCARAGCYEKVKRTKRSPLKKFCSWSCFQALRRVRERERRWLSALAYWKRNIANRAIALGP